MDIRGRLAAVPWFVWCLAAFQFVLHVATAGRYGIFRDELYYLSCADHLAWGYVDHPPLSIVVLGLVRGVAGESVVALRVLPALLGAAVVVLAADMSARLGGGRFAQLLTALCVALAPQYLGMLGTYSMNAIDVFLWVLVFVLITEILQTQPGRLWLAIGAVAGLGLLNKYSMAFLLAGLAAATPFTPLRASLRSRWLWWGAAVAVVLFLPHVIWQISHGWPSREFIQNAQAYKIADLTVGEFVSEQILVMLPPSALVWGAGLVALLFWPRLARFRALGIAFLAVFVILTVQNSKPYYLASAFIPLFAAGAVAWEALTLRRGLGWLRPVLVATIAVSGLALAPLAVPVLPVDTMIAYQQRLGLAPVNAENSELGPLPQHFADRFGWRELAQSVAAAYHELDPEVQASCLILARNYGEAGALRYFHDELGLPPVASQHNSHYLWGPGGEEFEYVVLVGYDGDGLRDTFEVVEQIGQGPAHPLAMPFEHNLPIHLCRGWRISLDEAWERGRLYI